MLKKWPHIAEPNQSRLESRGIMGLLQCGYGFPNLKTKEDESKALQPRPLLLVYSPASTGSLLDQFFYTTS